MSLDYESLFNKIDKAKKKRWSQADTDKWTKRQEKERKDKPNIKRDDTPFIKPKKYTKRQTQSATQRAKLLGESSGEETSGILSSAQRKARAAQAKLHGTKISTTPEPEHLSRVKLTPEQRRARKRNAKRRKEDKKEKEAKLTRANTPPKQPTPEQAQSSSERKDLETDLKTKLPFVSQDEAGTKERAEAELKIRREHKDRKAYRKRHSASRYRKWLDELDAEDRSAKERGEEAEKEKKTGKKQTKPKTGKAKDQEAEYKKLMEEAGRGGGTPIKARSQTISAKRARQDRKARKEQVDEPEALGSETADKPYVEPTEEAEHESNEEDDERGDVDKSLWKSWLEKKSKKIPNKEVKLPQTKIDGSDDKHMWDHSKVGRNTSWEDNPMNKPSYFQARMEEERQKKEKKKFLNYSDEEIVEEDGKATTRKKKKKIEKDATSKDEDECPFCDRPRVGGKADGEAARMFDWLLSSTTQEEYDGRSRAMKQVKNQHEVDVGGFHKKYRQGVPNVNFVRGKEKAEEVWKSWLEKTDIVDSTWFTAGLSREDGRKEFQAAKKRAEAEAKKRAKESDANKAEEGIGGMNMGSQRGLGHDQGSQQGSGESVQVTEVVDSELDKGKQIQDAVRTKIESMGKSAYENHEQNESPETEPTKRQIPHSKPKMDTFKSLYKKALITKYKNLYKPLNL